MENSRKALFSINVMVSTLHAHPSQIASILLRAYVSWIRPCHWPVGSPGRNTSVPTYGYTKSNNHDMYERQPMTLSDCLEGQHSIRRSANRAYSMSPDLPSVRQVKMTSSMEFTIRWMLTHRQNHNRKVILASKPCQDTFIQTTAMTHSTFHFEVF